MSENVQESTAWGRVVFVPVPLNPYAAELTNADERTAAWYGDFVAASRWHAAIAGTVSLNWLDALLTGASGAHKRIGYAASASAAQPPPPIQKLIAARGWPVAFSRDLGPPADAHEADNLAALVEPLTGAPGRAQIEIDLAGTWADAQNSGSPPSIVIAPGAGDPARIYPLEKLSHAIATLSDNGTIAGAEVRLLSGPGDADTCSRLQRLLVSAGIRPKTETTEAGNLRNAADLMRGARLVVCNESFWAHLASAVAVPTVVTWGLGHWPRFAPRHGRTTVVRLDMLCARCDWQCCFAERLCIEDIPPDAVAAAIRDRLLQPGAEGVPDIRILHSPRSVDFVRDALRRQLRQRDEILLEQSRLIRLLRSESARLEGQNADLVARSDQYVKVISEQTTYVRLLEAEVARIKSAVGDK